jgi:hypothetical protein
VWFKIRTSQQENVLVQLLEDVKFCVIYCGNEVTDEARLLDVMNIAFSHVLRRFYCGTR